MKNEPKKSALQCHDNDLKFPLSDQTAEILAEQIKLLYQQSKTAFLAMLFLSLVLVFVLWDVVSTNWLLGWLAAVYLITFIRFLLVWSYFQRKPSVVESVIWGRLFVLGVFFSGLLWGAAGSIFFVDDSAIHQLFLAYLLGGVVAGAMTTLSSYKGAFLIFSMPVTFSFAYQTITHGVDAYIAIAVTYLLFLFMMASISQQLHRTITDSLRLRFDNFTLVNRLLQAKNNQNAINQQLQTQIAEKDRTKKALQAANSQLEQRVIERTEALTQSNTILQQEKELFRITLASIGDAVITTDSLGKLTYLT